MSKSEAIKVIFDFMTKENRPFSVNDITEKCGKQFGKALVQKTLEALVEKRNISEKTYGKQKIYFVTQAAANSTEIKKELQSLTQKLTQSQNSLKAKQAEYRALEAQLKNITKVRSIESLEDERDKLMDEIREANEKLRRHDIVATEMQINPAEAKKIEQRYEQVSSAYRKRKRICNEMLDAILEGYPKTKRHLLEDIGVETDESVGFDLKLKN